MDIQVSFEEIRHLLKELAISQKETDRKFKETELQFKETDRKLNKMIHQFESQWGKFVESLVNGNLIQLLRNKGIDVRDTSQRRTGIHNGRQFEFDIIAKNGNELVIVEVKSHLNIKTIKEFLNELSHARQWLDEYAAYKIYGAVAYLHASEESPKFAERHGLFVIRATGDSAIITNSESFVPTCW
ncbi:MAG: hypothetical protein WBO44_04070 [Saprospiraceae bacterium]